MTETEEKELETRLQRMDLIIGLLGYHAISSSCEDDDEVRETFSIMKTTLGSRKSRKQLQRDGFSKESIDQAREYLQGFIEAAEEEE